MGKEALELSEEEELERIRQQKIAELQARQQREAQRAAAMRAILTSEARQRLANLKLVKPDLVETLENHLIQLVNSGKVKVPIEDKDVKAILDKLIPPKRGIRIERR